MPLQEKKASSTFDFTAYELKHQCLKNKDMAFTRLPHIYGTFQQMTLKVMAYYVKKRTRHCTFETNTLQLSTLQNTRDSFTIDNI